MKSLFMRLTLSAFLFGMTGTAFSQSIAEFPESRHNFGAIYEDDGPAECSFPVINTGVKPLTILSARATCGCTTPVYPRKSISPGDTAYITVAYDPSGRPGRFSKDIYVETNGTPSKVRLEISGVVIGNEATVGRRYPVDFKGLRLSKPVFNLGDATMGKLKTVYLEGYNQTADSITLQLTNVPAYMDVVAAPRTAPPGEQVTIIAYVAPHKGALYGVSEDTIMISGDNGGPFPLPVMINVHEDFSKLEPGRLDKSPIAVPSTERIELGRISKDGPSLRASLKLENGGKNPLEVRRVYSVDKAVKTKISSNTIKKGKSATIDIEIDPGMIEGDMLNSRIQIITNDPLHPVYTVRVVGEFL